MGYSLANYLKHAGHFSRLQCSHEARRSAKRGAACARTRWLRDNAGTTRAAPTPRAATTTTALHVIMIVRVTTNAVYGGTEEFVFEHGPVHGDVLVGLEIGSVRGGRGRTRHVVVSSAIGRRWRRSHIATTSVYGCAIGVCIGGCIVMVVVMMMVMSVVVVERGLVGGDTVVVGCRWGRLKCIAAA